MTESTSLKEILVRQGCRLDEKALQDMETLASLLQRGNQKINLTAVKGYHDILVRHILDCLIPVVEGWKIPRGRGCDVGTGAGFPGLVYAVLRKDADWVLVDSNSSKISWINDAARILCLEHVTAVWARVEDLGRAVDHREQYDLCLARAVATGTVMLEYCLPLVKLGGELWSWQGGNFVASDWEEPLMKLGGDLTKVVEYELPAWRTSGPKYIARVRKCSPTPERFPRRTGIPKKRPL